MSKSESSQRMATLVFLRYENAEVSNIGILNLRTLLATDSEVEAALVSATTQWVSSTEEGRKLWNYSCADLNIGDLAGCCAFQDASLLEAMKERGLEFVECIVSDSDGAISFDKVLVDEAALSDEKPEQEGAQQ